MEVTLVFSFNRCETRIQSPQTTLTKAKETPKFRGKLLCGRMGKFGCF